MPELRDQLIQFVNGHHLADSRVVVEDRITLVLGRIEISQTGFRPADELGIAEYDPCPFRSVDKHVPERLQWRGDLRARLGNRNRSVAKDIHQEYGQAAAED